MRRWVAGFAAVGLLVSIGAGVAAPSKPPPSLRCFVRDTMVFYDRTHIRCYNKTGGGIMYFAVDTAQPIAASVVSKALQAMQTGKPLKIVYAPASDLNPPGCDKANCRRLLDLTL